MQELHLNPSQRQAVFHDKGAMMVLSGPGSGKTTVIAYRVKNLIENIKADPSEILVITFSKASSLEMEARIQNIVALDKAVRVSTFHAFFFRILRMHAGIEIENVLNDGEKRNILFSILKKLDLQSYMSDEFIQGIQDEISLIKNDLLDIAYYNSMIIGNEHFKNIFAIYEEYKKTVGKLDFDDMLEKAYVLLRDNKEILNIWSKKYKYILVDEFQDVNKAQYDLIKLVASAHKNIFIVGDDDQSIYRFRGARPEFMLNFHKDYNELKTVVLNVNYRSTDQIISIANSIIKENKNRFEKNIKGLGEAGPKPKIMLSYDREKEALHIGKKIKAMGNVNLNSISVLYRTNMQARAISDAFMNLNIPFKIKDSISLVYEHWAAKDICAYLRLAIDRRSNEDLVRIINKPKRYISKAHIMDAGVKNMNLIDYLYSSPSVKQYSLSKVEELMFYLNSLKSRNTYEAIKYIRFAVGYDDYIRDFASYRNINPKGLLEIVTELMEAAKNYEKIEDYLIHAEKAVEENKNNTKKLDLEGVNLSTIHSAKGLEYETVFIAGCIEGFIPYEKSKTDAEIEEERRLLYVGVTRAKKNLFISVVETKNDEEVKPSRFLGSFKNSKEHSKSI